MNDYEKKYWSENEFLNSDGQNYSGYVGIRKGQGYIYTTGEKLQKRKNFFSQFNVSGNFFDRILDEPLQLPHSKKEVQYQPNDWLYRGTIKTIIRNLQENTQYLFKCSTIGETMLPTQNTPDINDEITNPQNTPDINDEITNPNDFIDYITVSDSCVVVKDDVNGDDKEYIYLFLGFFKENESNGEENESKLVIIRLNLKDFSECEKIEMTKVDKNRSNSITFKEIVDVKVNLPQNHLYIIDKTLGMIVRYDIEALFDSFADKSICLLDILQGEDSINDAIYFDEPCSVTFDDDYIYIADQGNNCVKKYTQSFDYIKTLKNGSFADQQIECVKINPYTFKMENGQLLPKNTLWVFSTNEKYIYVSVIYENTVLYSRRLQKIKLLDDEYIKSVSFSQNNSNYYFICTTKRIYKFHLTKPFYPFGSFVYDKKMTYPNGLVWDKVIDRWDKLSTPWGEQNDIITDIEISNNKTFSICGNDKKNGDVIFHVYEDSNKNVKVKLYIEPTKYISLLANWDFMIYDIDDMQNISHEEYINPQTFNKVIYKLVNNLIKLKNTIMGRFLGTYIADGLMTYNGIEYDDFFQSFSIEKPDDLFVHSNEQVSIMMNRIFEKIYDVQERLLERMEAKYSVSSLYSYKTMIE